MTARPFPALTLVVLACAGASGIVASCGSSTGDSLFNGTGGTAEDASATGGKGGGDDASIGGNAGKGGQGGSGGVSGKGGSSGQGGATGKGGTGGGQGGSAGSAVVCATKNDCVQKLGSDACKTNLDCDLATSVCTYTLLDKDTDQHSPVVCGGDDCNDNDLGIHPGAPEVCDGKDNNCDNSIDNGATCSGLLQCLGGACACPPANACGAECVDKSTSNAHCGQCSHPCTSGATCVAGTCVCGGAATLCPAGCVDLNSDPSNCGSCGAQCAQGYACISKACTCTKTPCSGSCVDTQTDPNHCGNCTTACPAGSTCQAGNCVCGGGLTLCSGSCVNTLTSNQHCGSCNHPCGGTCQNGICNSCQEADLLLVLDTSGSMGPPDGGTTGKLDYARTGISTFLNQTQSNGLGVGLVYFAKPLSTTPSSCSTGDECGCGGTCFINMCLGAGDLGAISDYSTPDVPIALIPGNTTAINNVIDPLQAGGGTPPASLQGPLTYAKSFAQSNTGHKVAVVLIADGLPNECTSNPDTATDWLPAVTSAATGSPPIRTYVISLGDSSTSSGFNAVASAGGTNTARFASSSYTVRTALEAIRAEFKTCP